MIIIYKKKVFYELCHNNFILNDRKTPFNIQSENYNLLSGLFPEISFGVYNWRSLKTGNILQ